MVNPTLVVKFKHFKSLLPWDTLLAEAGEFATKIGRERLISISHSHTGFDPSTRTQRPVKKAKKR